MGDTIVSGLKPVALHFGRSVRQVQRWAKEGMPRLSRRRYDLVQIQLWLDKRDGQAPGPPIFSGDPWQPDLPVQSGKEFWDAQNKKFQAQRRELELKKRRGELVERQEVEQLFVARIMAVKQGLLILARALPPQLATCRGEREMEPIIHRAVQALLETFARPLPESLCTSANFPEIGAVLDPEVAQVADLALIGDLKKEPPTGNQEDNL